MISFILLLIVGYIFYKIFENYEDTHPHAKGGVFDRKMVENSEFSIVVTLMAKLAKADGRVTELEAQFVSNALTDISHEFVQPAAARKILKEIFNESKEAHISIGKFASYFYDLTIHDLHKRHKVLEFLVNLAYIDGSFGSYERKILDEIAYNFRVDDEVYHQFLNSMEKQFASHSFGIHTLDQAYHFLGVKPSDSDQVIKRRYRELVKKHHPDIVRGQGKDQHSIEEATRKLQQINEAYEMIKKSR
jgi:DnaJ like chaperone protein